VFLFAGIVGVEKPRRGKDGERSGFTRGETVTWVNKDNSYWCSGVCSRDRYDVCSSDEGTPRDQKGADGGEIRLKREVFIYSSNRIQERRTVTARHHVAE
jgi:hypothetical protein